MTSWERFKKFYRVFRWVALAAVLFVLFLILRQAPAPEIQTDPRAAQDVQLKVYRAEQALQSGEPHALEMNEAQLNTFLHSNLALASTHGANALPVGTEPTLEEVKSSVRDVRINLAGNQVRAYLLFNLYGKDMSLILEGTLGVVDGYLRLTPTSGTLGSLPIPQASLDNAVRRLFDSPENREKFRVPPHISDIFVEAGQLTVLYNQ